MSLLLAALLQADTAVFYFINVSLSNPVFDVLMPFVTTKQNWYLPFVALLTWLIITEKQKGLYFLLLILITLLLNDQITNSLLKPLVGRLRPCKTLENFRLLVSCGGRFSFPSSHASNAMALMTLFSFKYKRLMPGFILIAFTVGYSRIYVGVHYPADVLIGFLVGYLCALGATKTLERLISGLALQKNQDVLEK